jgi:hypothetical protein
MSVVTYIGAAASESQVTTATVGSSTSGQIFTLVTGNAVEVATYTAGGSDTTATIAAALLAAAQANTAPELIGIEFAEGSAANIVEATGAPNGQPFTLTNTGSTGTLTMSTTAPSSPNDVSIGANYSTGALPTASSTLILEDTEVDLLWNLSALTNAITVIRRSSYTGTIGLPDVNTNGYPEYRPTHLSLNATSILIEQPSTDQYQQIRITGTSTSACNVSVQGSSGTNIQLGSECLEVTGLTTGSSIYASEGSVSVAPFAAQTAAVSVLNGEGATISCGSGVTFGSGSLESCTASIRCNYTTLSMTGTGGTTLVQDTAGGTNTNVFSGTLTWQSTGSPGANPVVGPGGTLDFSEAPASISGITSIELNATGSLLDPGGRLAQPYNIHVNRTQVGATTLDIGTDQTITVG